MSSDEEEESFQEYFGSMPWLALGLKDQRGELLDNFCEVTCKYNLLYLSFDETACYLKSQKQVLEQALYLFHC